MAVRIPKTFAREAKLEDGTEVDLSVSKGYLLIAPRAPEYRLEEMVGRITPQNHHDETDWGEPVGREAW